MHCAAVGVLEESSLLFHLCYACWTCTWLANNLARAGAGFPEDVGDLSPAAVELHGWTPCLALHKGRPSWPPVQ